jgi:hypothetical protein
LDSQPGGFGEFDQSHTVSTMLFGCHRYLEAHGTEVSPEKERIEAIMAELEAWMAERGHSYTS